MELGDGPSLFDCHTHFIIGCFLIASHWASSKWLHMDFRWKLIIISRANNIYKVSIFRRLRWKSSPFFVALCMTRFIVNIISFLGCPLPHSLSAFDVLNSSVWP